MKSKHNQSGIPSEVREFLSENGKKGGNVTKNLIEKGRLYEEEHEEDVDTISKSANRSTKRAA